MSELPKLVLMLFFLCSADVTMFFRLFILFVKSDDFRNFRRHYSSDDIQSAYLRYPRWPSKKVPIVIILLPNGIKTTTGSRLEPKFGHVLKMLAFVLV